MQDLFIGVDWKSTAIVNTIRALCTGFVLGVIYAAAYIKGADKDIATLLAPLWLPFATVLYYWFFGFPIAYITSKSSIVPIRLVGIAVMLSIIVCGDPLYFLLGRIMKIVPYSPDMAPMNFTPIFLILRDDVKHVNPI